MKKLNLKGKRVLDMGAGTGAIAMIAAVNGAVTTAADINPAAVELCKRNSYTNSLEIEVVESDLFSNLSDRQFDLVLFNVPFYPNPSSGLLDSAFNAGKNFEVIKRFACDVPLHLPDDGMVMIIFSEDSGFGQVTGLFDQAGLGIQQTVRKTAIFEHFHIVTFRRKNLPGR